MGGFRDGPLSVIVCCAVSLLVMTGSQPAWSCDSQLNPSAFQFRSFIQHTLLPNGMMAFRYPETDQEFAPHVSVHRVMMIVPGLQQGLPESNDTHYRVIEVDGGVGWMTYLVAAHALFYGMGEDSLGFPKKTWIDPQEDGLNGNEHLNGQTK